MAEVVRQEDIPASLAMNIKSGRNGKIIFFGDPEFVKECAAEWRRKDAEKQGKMSGSYGQVFKVTVRGANYFVKFVNATDDKFERGKILLTNEVIAAIKLTTDLPWAVSNLRGAVYAEDNDRKLVKLYLIFEGPDGYNLRDYIDLMTHEFLQRKGLYPKIYCSINTAREAVNNLGYVHRDIKPENIFVEVEPDDRRTFVRCKLIDLGFVVSAGKRTGRAGTPKYWPKSMNNYNTYVSTHDAKAGVYHNIHSVETIWTEDFQQDGPPPSNCSEIDIHAAAAMAFPPTESSNDEEIPLLEAYTVAKPPLGPSRARNAATLVGTLARTAGPRLGIAELHQATQPFLPRSNNAAAILGALARAPKGGRKTRRRNKKPSRSDRSDRSNKPSRSDRSDWSKRKTRRLK
jgi:serine/threonine protein kinase